MKIIKTYDGAGNISDETYIEDKNGLLVEIKNVQIGDEVDTDCTVRRIYYESLSL